MNITQRFPNLVARVCSLLVVLSALLLLPQYGQAAPEDRFSGWMWSYNVGWISMNCSNTDYCGTVDYGVNLASDGSTVSGWAWSPNLGWIDFSGVTYNNATNELSGAARVISGEANSDGFDGYIRFKNTGGVTYGAVLDDSDDIFDGYAWGSTVVGWTVMSCQTTNTCGTVNYGVKLDPFYFAMSANRGLSSGDAVPYGENFQISWTTFGATSCFSSGGDGNWTNSTSKPVGEPSTAAFTVVGADENATYSLTCENAEGKEITREIDIYMGDPLGSVTLSADDTNLAYGGSTIIRWTTEDVDTCIANGAWSGAKTPGTNRSQSTGSLTNSSNNYQLSCTGPGISQPIVDSVIVYVETLSVDMYPSTNFLIHNEEVEITWETENATGGCVASGNSYWTGAKASTDGTHTEMIGPLDESGVYEFILTCNGVSGQTEIASFELSAGRNPGYTEEIGN